MWSQTSEPQSTFDVIFTWHVHEIIPAVQHAAALRHWATFLTPGTGRIALTLDMPVEDLGEIAGTVLIDKYGEILQCCNMMLDSEWAVGEQALAALIAAAGLHLGVTQRVGYGVEEALQWTNHGEEYHEHAVIRHSQVLEEDIVDPEWTPSPDTSRSQ